MPALTEHQVKSIGDEGPDVAIAHRAFSQAGPHIEPGNHVSGPLDSGNGLANGRVPLVARMERRSRRRAGPKEEGIA